MNISKYLRISSPPRSEADRNEEARWLPRVCNLAVYIAKRDYADGPIDIMALHAIRIALYTVLVSSIVDEAK